MLEPHARNDMYTQQACTGIVHHVVVVQAYAEIYEPEKNASCRLG